MLWFGNTGQYAYEHLQESYLLSVPLQETGNCIVVQSINGFQLKPTGLFFFQIVLVFIFQKKGKILWRRKEKRETKKEI